ncbi:MAG: T9SS type A sorting domain-containing protein [Bacteroidota bacterium]
MKNAFSLLLILFSFSIQAQNLAQCDSLVIDCCGFGLNTVTVTVSNTTTELFDYPGFILFNTNMDTIAKETVNYFGIGQGPQTFYMTVYTPFNLPFTGYLNLYTSFYDSLDCSFPITISDTINAIEDLKIVDGVKLFPNPSTGFFNFQLNKTYQKSKVQIINVLGEVMDEKEFSNTSTFQLKINTQGIYFIEITTDNGNKFHTKLLVKH